MKKYHFKALHAGEDIASGREFYNSPEEVRQQLISYHGADWEAESDINEMTLEDILDYGQWELVEVEVNEYEALIKTEEWVKLTVLAENEEDAHERTMEAQAEGEGEGQKIDVQIVELTKITD